MYSYLPSLLISPLAKNALEQKSIGVRQKLIGLLIDLILSDISFISQSSSFSPGWTLLFQDPLGDQWWFTFYTPPSDEGSSHSSFSSESKDSEPLPSSQATLHIYIDFAAQSTSSQFIDLYTQDDEILHQSYQSFNPFTHVICSPEQAMIRRAFMTQREEIHFIDAPPKAGLSWGLLLGLVESLEERQGRFLFLTQRPDWARQFLKAIAPDDSQRIDFCSHDQFFHSFFSSNSLSFPSIAYSFWDPFKKWFVQHQKKFPHWSPFVEWVYHLLINKIWIHTEEERESVLQNILSQFPPSWQKEYREIESLGRKTPLYEYTQRTPHFEQEWKIDSFQSQVESDEFQQVTKLPYYKANYKGVIVDDCLALQENQLSHLIRLFQSYFSRQKGRWLLIFAGREHTVWGQGGGKWSKLDVMCRGILNRWTTQLQLTQSESQSSSFLKLLHEIETQYERLPFSIQPRFQSALPSPLSVQLNLHSSYQSQPIHWITSPLPQSNQESIDLIYTLLGTPHAFLLDFDLTSWNALLDQPELTSIHHQARKRLCSLDQLTQISPQVLWVKGLDSFLRWKDLPTQTHPQSIRNQIDTLRWIVSRCRQCIVWLGDFPSVLNVESPLFHMWPLENTFSYFETISPWRGRQLFKKVQQADQYQHASLWIEAHTSLKEIEPLLYQALGAYGKNFFKQAIQPLREKALESALLAKEWKQAQSLLESAQLSDLHTHLFHLGIKEILQEGEENIHHDQFDNFIHLLSDFNDLEKFPPFQECFPQVRTALWQWSLRLLKKPIPQSSLQSQILSLLHRFSPSISSYSHLLGTYQIETPNRIDLCKGAERLLKEEFFSPSLRNGNSNDRTDHPIQSIEIQRKKWILAHLERWMRVGLLPQQKDAFIDPLPKEIALGFTLIALRDHQWSLGDLLLSYVASTEDSFSLVPSQVLISREQTQRDHKSQEVKNSKALHRYELIWKQEIHTLKQNQSLHEKREEYRQHGQLDLLQQTYSIQDPPPSHLRDIFHLYDLLKKGPSFWNTLTFSEQNLLMDLWTKTLNSSRLKSQSFSSSGENQRNTHSELSRKVVSISEDQLDLEDIKPTQKKKTFHSTKNSNE